MFEERSATSSEERGRHLFFSKVLKLTEASIIGDLLFVKSFCAAEMSKHKDYNVKILLNLNKSNSCIQQASCDCIGGNGCGWSSACKHVAALAYSIEHYKQSGECLELISKTSVLQTWHHLPFGRMVQAKSVFEMLDITPPDIEQAPGRSAEFLNILINSRIDSAAIKIRNINMQSYFHDHNYVPNLPVCMLNEINKVSPEEIQNIEANTCKQSGNKLWHQMRRTRITGAIIGSIARTVRIGNYAPGPAIRQFRAKPFNSPAIKWGKQNELCAITEYQRLVGGNVRQCGIFIDQNLNYLAALPDGICGDPSTGKAVLLEVKCPYSIRHTVPTQAPYLIAGKKHYHLNKRHDYYSKIQLQLWVTKLDVCDFVVWTPNGIYIENIVKGTTYCQKIIKRADLYYKGVFASKYFLIQHSKN